MAPLPPGSTTRLYLKYTSMGREHVSEIRVGIGGSTAVFAQLLQDMATVNALRMLTADSSIGAEYSIAGSNIRFPLPHTAVPGVVSGVSQWSQDPDSTELTITGKGSSTGRRWRYTLFSPVSTVVWPNDNRYNRGEQAVIDTWFDNVQNLVTSGGSTGVQLITIGGDLPILNQYVNISQNGYWQRMQR